MEDEIFPLSSSKETDGDVEGLYLRRGVVAEDEDEEDGDD